MSKHTPGPWKVAHERPLFGLWHVRQDPKDWDGQGYQAIATIPASNKGTHYGEMFQANAHLISAAPDLYAVVKEIADHLYAEQDYARVREMARAAIAKAEGGAQ